MDTLQWQMDMVDDFAGLLATIQLPGHALLIRLLHIPKLETTSRQRR